jgi:C4-dicarboxylate-binding protein DctP
MRLVLSGVLLILCLIGGSANGAPVTIRLTLQLPPESLLYQNIKQFADRVAEQSKGELKVEVFPSSKLYQAHEVPKAVGSGQIEMGASLLSQYAEVVPATDIFAVPFLFSEPKIFEAATASASGIRAPLDDAIRVATGARVLWWVPNGAEAMGSKSSALGSPDDFKGKRIRVAGATIAEFVKNCGGVPVIAPGSAQYGVLQRGEVDAVSTSIESLVSRELWHLVDRITLLHHARQAFVILINESFWQSLPEEQRRILAEAAASTEHAAQNQDALVDRKSIEFLKKRGLTVVEATESDRAEWKECSSPVSEIFLSKSGPTGEKVMAEYRRLLLRSAGVASPAEAGKPMR